MSLEKPTIFVVDDDEAVRKALVRGLKLRGYLVETFASAKAFLDAFDANKKGCLLLDQGMPEMTGLELQKILLDGGYSIPTIFMTGHGGSSDFALAMKQGAVGFLEKPFRNEQLFEQITKALGTDASPAG